MDQSPAQASISQSHGEVAGGLERCGGTQDSLRLSLSKVRSWLGVEGRRCVERGREGRRGVVGERG